MSDREFDLLILDLMLPGISGHEVCQKLRARKNFTPILMLTALDSTDERILGLKVGADDYLPKPFDFDELVARLNALYRRVNNYSDDVSDTTLNHGGLNFDRNSMLLTVDGEERELSSKERDLVVFFLSNENKSALLPFQGN